MGSAKTGAHFSSSTTHSETTVAQDCHTAVMHGDGRTSVQNELAAINRRSDGQPRGFDLDLVDVPQRNPRTMDNLRP